MEAAMTDPKQRGLAWARRQRPICTDPTVSIEDKGVYACITARNPYSDRIYAPSRAVAAKRAGIDLKGYNACLDHLIEAGYLDGKPIAIDDDLELYRVPFKGCEGRAFELYAPHVPMPAVEVMARG